METAGSVRAPVPKPHWLNAELTYKCPLHCVFCYNPVDYTKFGPELSTDGEPHRTSPRTLTLSAISAGLGIAGFLFFATLPEPSTSATSST